MRESVAACLWVHDALWEQRKPIGRPFRIVDSEERRGDRASGVRDQRNPLYGLDLPAGLLGLPERRIEFRRLAHFSGAARMAVAVEVEAPT